MTDWELYDTVDRKVMKETDNLLDIVGYTLHNVPISRLINCQLVANGAVVESGVNLAWLVHFTRGLHYMKEKYRE